MLERLRSKSGSRKASDKDLPPREELPEGDRANGAEADDGGAWRLAEEESGEDEILQVRTSNAGLSSSAQAGVATGASPRSGTSTVASYSQKEPSAGAADVVVPAGSSLLDGLRLLLVHHLKGSAGTEQISLTTGQAELLEHHLARLASYAQKIVHTLAFATRFLTTQPAVEEPSPAAGSLPVPADDATLSSGKKEAISAEPRKRSTLRLKDRELLKIYRSAQLEASREADWRGLGAASPSRSEGSDFSDFSQRSALNQGATAQGSDAEFLKALSRAMRQPGRNPEELAAEIVDSSVGFGCCQSQKGLAAREARGASSSMVRWPQSPPDPGGRHGRA